MKVLKAWKQINERDRVIYKNVIGSFAIKGAALMLSFFTMPAYMRYFSDQEILGVWFTVLSVLSWILNFDLGIGNGLRNKLSTSFAEKDDKISREYISSAYGMIGILVIIAMVIIYAASPLVNWNFIFNVDMQLVSADILLRVVQIVFMGIMLQFLLKLISSVLYAMQKSAINNLITFSSSFIQFLFVVLAPEMDAVTALQVFAIAYVICVNLPFLVATIVVFASPMKKSRPSILMFRWDKAKSVLSLGGIFFLCQVLYMIIANTNEFLITQYTSPSNVVEYQIYNKLFSLGSTLFMLALTPVWSAVSKAVAEKDFNWIDRMSKQIARLSFVAILFEVVLVVILQFVVNIWLGSESIEVNYCYAICFALFGSAMLYQTGISTIVNGLGRMKIQAICYFFGIIVKFIVIHFGMQTGANWILIIFSNVLILVPYCIIQQIDLSRYIKKCVQEDLKK